MMSDKQKRKKLDGAKEDRFNMTNGFNLLKKCVPGTYKLSRAEILISAVNYIGIIEECIRKMRKENSSGVTDSTLKSLRYKVLITPMDDHSGPIDSTLDSLTHTVPSTPTSMEEYSGQELTVPSTPTSM
jgi:hypothetical protein